MSKVKICAVNGKVVNAYQNNPEYGYVRVEAKVSDFNDQGFMTTKTRSALIRGEVKDLATLGVDGQSIDGHIIIKDQLEPVNPNDPEQGLKRAGEGGPVCTVEGQPIYRTSFFSKSAMEDITIAHDNGDEIAAYNAEQAAKAEAAGSETDLTEG